ncbi:hypothetical protein G7067_12970 [Leucobacter insecticola]|uniref:Uncharacterized protein n=1 Tax=Leucobacter insecticola TaxID=2714934 RepID=A0A6G8FMB3_9MICO|nr:hypothetical protein G7067_12970 [Leucobacter insecticola]
MDPAAIERTRIKIELWRLALPVLWFGMIAAISFIEAPLKFQAPGITIPLGLGIGRLVFAVLNIAEAAILLAITLLSFWPISARIEGRRLLVWFGLILVFAAKVAGVRPPLNARTDLVIAGADPGQSPWHYLYIACDLVTMVLLVLLAVTAARAILHPRNLPPRTLR